MQQRICPPAHYTEIAYEKCDYSPFVTQTVEIIILSPYTCAQKLDTIYDTFYNGLQGENHMSQFDKLLARLKSLDKNMQFEEVKRILESFGYHRKRGER